MRTLLVAVDGMIGRRGRPRRSEWLEKSIEKRQEEYARKTVRRIASPSETGKC